MVRWEGSKMGVAGLTALAIMSVCTAAVAQGATVTGGQTGGMARKPGSEGAAGAAGASLPASGGHPASTAPRPGGRNPDRARNGHATTGPRGKVLRRPASGLAPDQ